MQVSEILIEAFGRIRENVHRVADGMSADDLAFRPDADANSIAWLVWHLTRIQDDHVADLAGATQVWSEGDWPERLGFTGDLAETGYGHTTEQVAAIRPDGPEQLIGYHDAVYQRTLDYVRGVAEADLDRVVDYSWDPPVTAGVRLVSVVNDNMQHSGQAGYVRGMIERLRNT